MHIAILGATSQIAKDLILSILMSEGLKLTLFARRPEIVRVWLKNLDINRDWTVLGYEDFNTKKKFDAVINFVGVGDPAQAAAMGATIFEVTRQYDDLAINYLKAHPNCRYLFLSSGAAYGSKFDRPVDENSIAHIAINGLKPQDWYGVAKLYAESQHRSLSALHIVDIRVFNYFSHTQNMDARFLITDIMRAIRDGTVLMTSEDYIVRDYIGPADFYRLVKLLLITPATNDVIDCYSKAPIEKPALLAAMKEQFGLRYEFVKCPVTVNATGTKPYYYSLNKRAAIFGYEPSVTSLMNIESVVREVVPQFRRPV